MSQLDFIMRVLDITSIHRFDCAGELTWRTDGRYAPISFFVDCSDLFYWGCADSEPLTPENVDEFERAYEDLKAQFGYTMASIYGSMLFCARQRKLRPQGCCYPDDRALWPLFDECGPEREVGLGNPYPPGGGRGK